MPEQGFRVGEEIGSTKKKPDSTIGDAMKNSC